MKPVELAVLALAGGSLFFSFVAALGVVRLPDVYSRAHATSKSDTMGTGLALVAVALVLDSGVARLKLAFLAAFVLLTNPVAAHAITRAAYLQGIPAWRGSESGSEGVATEDEKEASE
ncbi:monovalent cation/H(+) antiporter subunit G [Haloarchaeobius sp. TZWWS8]|uniref:monovalent cation/H(+) antiporter subunit G n=1 Tax=Haloarchaeobius sp. TZWWS8 TaxID=3446121 RepID=UPI003EB987E8